MSERKDYYKILEITGNATDAEIRKAYKKLALKYHPDKFNGTEEEKVEWENKFKDVVEAYGVLSDPEKKNKYDRGDDPEGNDDNLGGFGFGGGHHHHHHHHHHNFGGFFRGGSFSFRFV